MITRVKVGQQITITDHLSFHDSYRIVNLVDGIDLQDAATVAQIRAGQAIAGAGLTKTGNTIDVVSANESRIIVNDDSIDLATVLQLPDVFEGGGNSFITAIQRDNYGRVTGITLGSVQIATSTSAGIASFSPANFNIDGAGIVTLKDGGIPVAALAFSSISLAAGTGITLSSTTATLGGTAVTITNSGVTSITGTPNQVLISASTGGVTLSLPQNIHTAATPVFASLTITNIINGQTGVFSGNVSGADATANNHFITLGQLNNQNYLTSFTETDPTVPAYVKGITTTNISNWNTAFSWGNHAGLYPLLTGSYNNPTWINTLAWSKITGAPTFLTSADNYWTKTGNDIINNNTGKISLAGNLYLPNNGLVYFDNYLVFAHSSGKHYVYTAPQGIQFVNYTNTANIAFISDAGDFSMRSLTLTSIPASTSTSVLVNNGGLIAQRDISSFDFITGNQNITLNGDVSGSGTTSITTTLATVNSNVGTFNNVTVNAKGLVTAASNVAYLTSYTETDPIWNVQKTNYYTKTQLQTSGQSAVHWNNITNSPSFITGNQNINVTGDVSGSGSTSIALTLANVNANVGTFNNVTVNSKGLVTAASTVSYLTSYTETDPTVPYYVKAITVSQINKWDSDLPAYGYINNLTVGAFTGTPDYIVGISSPNTIQRYTLGSLGFLTAEVDTLHSVTTRNSFTTNDIHIRDVFASRGDGTGVVYFASESNGGSRYLYYDGTNYNLPNASLFVGADVNTGGRVNISNGYNAVSVTSTSFTYTSISQTGWGGSHAMLFNAKVVGENGGMWADGNTKFVNSDATYSSRAGALHFLASGGVWEFKTSNVTTGANTNPIWSNVFTIDGAGSVYIPNVFFSATTGSSTQWNTAYGWGNHAGLYQPLENQRLSTSNNVRFSALEVSGNSYIYANSPSDPVLKVMNSNNAEVIAAYYGTTKVWGVMPTGRSYGGDAVLGNEYVTLQQLNSHSFTETDTWQSVMNRGSVYINSFSAGVFGATIVGASGAARDTLLVGQDGFSNGFTVQYTGSAMFYQMKDGDLSVTHGKVIAGDGKGFRNNVYNTNVANPIWSFLNAEAYGMAYYQGSALGIDAIGFHFGNISSPPCYVRSDGRVVGTDANATNQFVTLNQLNSVSSYWSASGANIYNINSGNVGINTTVAYYKLDVNGTIRTRTGADSSYTNPRIIVYGGDGVDGNNWGYFGYGVDAIMRVTYGKNYGGALYFGTSTSMDSSGTFQEAFRMYSGTGSGTFTILGSSAAIRFGSADGSTGQLALSGGGTYWDYKGDMTLRSLDYSTSSRAVFYANGTVQFPRLGGSGTRMVVADSNGVLSTQAIPSVVSAFTNDVGYITSYTETDTLNSVTSRGNSTSNSIRVNYNRTLDNSSFDNANFVALTDSGNKPGYGFHAQGYYGALFYMNNYGDYRTREATGSEYGFWHSGNFDPNSKANTNGSNASGTWAINITGSSSYSTNSDNISNNAGSYMHFAYSGNSGQPTWLWGTNDGVTNAVWNPSNFNVAYANTAGSTQIFYSQSHPSSYYLANNWDGTYWHITSNHGAAARVGYADNSGSTNYVDWANVGNKPSLGGTQNLQSVTNYGSTTTNPITAQHLYARGDGGGDGYVYLFDSPNGDYGRLSTSDGDFTARNGGGKSIFSAERGFGLVMYSDNLSNNTAALRHPNIMTDNRTYTFPDKSGTVAMLDDITSGISGYYTPTITDIANISSTTAYECMYIRVGNVVTVSGMIDIAPVSASTVTRVWLTTPIYSGFYTQKDAGGTGYSRNGSATVSCGFTSNTVNHVVELLYITPTTAVAQFSFSFSYRIR